ncbi:MAG: hypothetical protein H6R25_1132 [Proteobacteria bacterium]|nr:hypothetical protein [Pseudomonadota bacterium]
MFVDVIVPLITPPSDIEPGSLNLRPVLNEIHSGSDPEPPPDMLPSMEPTNVLLTDIGEALPKSILNAPEVAAVALNDNKHNAPPKKTEEIPANILFMKVLPSTKSVEMGYFEKYLPCLI